MGVKKMTEEEKEETLINEKEKLTGLTSQEVRERIANGQVNVAVNPPSKTTKQIVTSNVCTYFNLVFLIITIMLIVVGSFKELTFLPIIMANTLIGIFQELRAKKVLDNLTMLNTPSATILRDGEQRELPINELVKDDVVIFKAGNQIPADCKVIEGHVAVNESLLTGEENEIHKSLGDTLMSGSFIVSGECYAKLERVGKDSYISKLTLEAKAIKTGEQSEIIRSLNKIVKTVGIIIIPVGAILFYQQFFVLGESAKISIEAMVAAILGMIPEGLFLLASVTLVISAMKLATEKVLLHDMKSIETLARVDTLCVDKTGTITDGTMKVVDVYHVNKKIEAEKLTNLIGDFAAAQNNDNITMEAIKKYFIDNTGRKARSVAGFSSKYKYSGVEFEDISLVLGAPDILLSSNYENFREKIEEYNKVGYRVLAFGKYSSVPDGNELTGKVEPYSLIVLENPIREKAVETFEYFYNQGVDIKVISGDNPLTVSKIAEKAKIKNASQYLDMRTIKTDEELEEAALKYTVFGRVTPEQKRKLVQALKRAGHTVAMTGDGVNDVLALKDADCSIAMASGSDAAVQTSQLVLLESDFSKMPSVVREGRKVVNNLQRSGSLFLVKNIFSMATALLSIFFALRYPLKPSQISLISMFTIGIPGLLLSQIPNTELIKGNFIGNIMAKALPGGVTNTILVIMMVLAGILFDINMDEISTASTILLGIVGLIVLYSISRPMDIFKTCIWITCTIGITISVLLFKDLFSLNESLSLQTLYICLLLVGLAKHVFKVVTTVTEWFISLHKRITTNR